MRLRYDVGEGKFVDNIGVSLRTVQGFEGMEALAPKLGWIPKLAPYKKLIEMLEKKFGYTKDLDLGAITYDWRRGPTHGDVLFPQMKAEIERLYGTNGGARAVTFISHSLGSMWALHFLQHGVDAAWRTQYINSWI